MSDHERWSSEGTLSLDLSQQQKATALPHHPQGYQPCVPCCPQFLRALRGQVLGPLSRRRNRLTKAGRSLEPPAELGLPPSLPRPAIVHRPGQQVPRLWNCPSPRGQGGPRLSRQGWKPRSTEAHSGSTSPGAPGRDDGSPDPIAGPPETVAPSLCHLPGSGGVAEPARNRP